MYSELDKDLQIEQRNFNDRLGFIRKVYAILFMQLSVTVFITGLAVGIESFGEWLKSSLVFILVCVAVNITTLIVLVCFQKVARTYPTNMIFLGIFTLSESFLVACISAFYDPMSILIAALMTLGVTLGVTAYACTTKTDFTTMRGFIAGMIIGLILFSIFMGLNYSERPIQVTVCLIFIIIYTLFIVIDTQRIAGGKRWSLSYDEYVFGALCLYIDIVRLFLEFLRLFKK